METGSDAKTIIAEDVEIVGSVKCSGNIEIKGKLEGDLNCGAKAVVGESALIKGSLTVDSISIQGQVDGNITAKDRIEMKSSARVQGDIKSKRLTVEDGVTFVGKSEVNPSGSQTARPTGSEKSAESSVAPATPAAAAKDDDKSKSGMFGRK